MHMIQFLPLQLMHCEKMCELDRNLQNMMTFLPLRLRHCANLHNMVKLSLNRLEQDQTKIMLVIAKHDEIHLLHSMVKFIYCTAW